MTAFGMKHLTLIRHAKSDHGSRLITDFQRPLSARGLRDAPLIGRHLLTTHAFAPDRVVTSPARRAATTASLVLEAAGLDSSLTLHGEPRIYEAPLPSLIEVVRSLPDASGHSVLFGHNPGLELLANWLCGTAVIDGLRTGGVIMLQLEGDRWSQAGPGTASLLTYFYPAQIGGGKQAHAD